MSQPDEPRTTARALAPIEPAPSPPYEGPHDGRVIPVRADAFTIGAFLVVVLVCLAYLLGRYTARAELGYSREPVVLRTAIGNSGSSGASIVIPAPGDRETRVAASGGSAGGTLDPAPGDPEAKTVPKEAGERSPGLPAPVTAWYIQPMHTMDEKEAKAAVELLKQQGYRAFYKKSPGTRIFVLNLGPYASQDREIFERVRTLKFQGRTRFRDSFWISY